MMRASRAPTLRRVITGACVLLFTAGCEGKSPAPVPPQPIRELRPETLGREPLKPLPEPAAVDPRLGSLGRRLFHEKRLSSDKKVACASCHDLGHGGDDGRPHSIGVQGRSGSINAPSVYNATLNFVLFWDGRATTLEEQVAGPLTHPNEMNSSLREAVSTLKSDPEYASAFTGVFGDGVTPDNIRKAIAAFERTLITVDSPFDRWLKGDPNAISAEQRAGYELFKGIGCIACHQGANVGGNMFQRFGVFGDYFKDRGHITEADYGRFNVTKNEADRFVFRVPSLRNVEHTAPYFHDGSAPTLTQAVQVMAKYQLGRKLSVEQVSLIVAFLKSLSGSQIAASDGV